MNIAVAVAMPDGGLITPVLREAEAVDIYTLSKVGPCVGGGLCVGRL